MEESEVEGGSSEQTIKVGGKTYRFKAILWKELKLLKKTAGKDVNMLNDLILISTCVEPKLTQDDLDVMKAGTIMKLNKAVAELSGIDLEKLSDF
jgi:hypothetical protein